MTEWFYTTNSNAAPFFSDRGEGYVEAETAEEAMRAVIVQYSHPAGLFALAVFPNADAFHKGDQPSGKWWSERAYKAEAPPEVKAADVTQ